MLMVYFEKQEYVDVIDILDKLYNWAVRKISITSNPQTFVQLSMDAMKRLEDNSKPNLVFIFCQGLAMDRPNDAGPLIPIHRMPFGLIQYCIEFFTCTNVMQVGATISCVLNVREIVRQEYVGCIVSSLFQGRSTG